MSFEEDAKKLNLRAIILSSVMTAFGLVIALAWKDAINATVAYLMPDNDTSTLYGIYVSAVGVTLLVTVLDRKSVV